MADDQSNGKGSWQGYLLGIGAVLIGAGIIGLTSTLTGVREDLAVVKRDIQYLTKQAESAEQFRKEVGGRLNDLDQRLRQVETDNTRRMR